jgi:hypothetical protein
MKLRRKIIRVITLRTNTTRRQQPHIITIKFNLIKFFIINVRSQQLQHQLQTQHNADIGNSIKDRHKIKTKPQNNNNNNNNSIQFFIYLCADSTAKCHLQSQHGHKQQKQWTTQGQYTKTGGL